MKYKNYIVSFAPGSSGRFIKALLDRIIKNSEEPIPVTNKNSAHDVLIPISHVFHNLSIDKFDVHHTDVYKYLKFLDIYSIFTSHAYPDFKLLNGKFNDVGIILVQFDIEDCPEIIINSWVKNGLIAHPSEIIEPKIKHKFNQAVYNWKRKSYLFIYDPNLSIDNTLILRYQDLYEKTENSYKVLEILKEFSGSDNIPNSTIEACDRYSEGRNILLKQAGLR